LGSHPASDRVDSVDLVRGLIVVVMLFVNDLASVSGAPAWLKHVAPPEADGMTLVDLVFPAFLFIVGLSLPIALERRLNARGLGPVLVHLVVRAASLLLIGVYMVNAEQLPADAPVYRASWNLLMYTGVILVWLVPRRANPNAAASAIRRWVGIVVLLGAALWYRNPNQEGWFQLQPHWWGILGLIGWAYLVSALVYLLLRHNPAAQVGVVGLLYCVYFADQVEFFRALASLDRVVDLGSMLGSLPAITLTGAIAGRMILFPTEPSSHLRRIVGAWWFGLALATAGLLLHALRELHPMFIVNKNAATPAWCLLSSAYTLWLWAGIHLVTDAAGRGGRPRWVADAGRNALSAFMAGPILYAVIELVSALLGGWHFYALLGTHFNVGLGRSLAFALGTAGLIGWLWRRGWTLKL
jgi:predicted acyltransferase